MSHDRKEPSVYDKAVFDMLTHRDFTIVLENDGTYTLQGEDEAFVLVDGEFMCLHSNWETETNDVPGPTPDHPDSSVSFAWCPVCEEDVSDDVGFYDPPEED